MNVEEAGLEVISALEDLDKSPIDVTKVSDDDPLLEIYYMLSRRNTTASGRGYAPSRPPKSYCRRSIQISKSTYLNDRQSHDNRGIGWEQSDSRQSYDGGLSAPSNNTIIGTSLVNGRFLY